MNQLKNELQRELLGEMTLEASDRVGNQFSVQRTPVGMAVTAHCTLHNPHCITKTATVMMMKAHYQSILHNLAEITFYGFNRSTKNHGSTFLSIL